MQSFIDYINAPHKKKRKIVILILALLSIFFIFTKSCMEKKSYKKRHYNIGKDSSWYPLNVYGRDKNLTAFIQELMTEVGTETGVRFSWTDVGFSSILAGLDNGTYDAMITSMHPDPYNEVKYIFSEPLLRTGLVLVMNARTPYASFKDIEGTTIGVQSSSQIVFDAFKRGGADPAEIHLVSYSNINIGLEAVSTGRIDGFLAESIPAYFLLETLFRGKLKVVTHPLTDEAIRLITLENMSGQVLIEEVNAAVEKIREDGQFVKLLEKWNLYDPNSKS